MEQPKKKKRKTFTRRDFLKGLGGGAVGVSATTRLLRQRLAAFESSEAKIPVLTKKLVTLIVNGRNFSLEVGAQETLLQVLRERLELKGTKKVCDRGECGGCTVLLEGKPIYSCSYLAIRADGKKITTIEGLAEGRKLHPVQQAFIDKDGYQCGFCTPSFIMTSVALLNKNKKPSLNEVKEALSGNICRCGNYAKIYEAVSAASEAMRKA